MPKTKKELQEELAAMGVEVNSKSTVAELKAQIEANAPVVEPVVESDEQAAEVIAEEQSTEAQVTAKAGKRSTKALREAAEQAEKEARKASGETVEEKPQRAVKPTRSRLERRGKAFRKNAELIEKGKAYSLEQAVELAQKTSHVKFDATVELHVNLGVDPRQADQNIRDNLVLPAGTGKNVRVAVFTDDPAAATQAGADIAGTEDLLKQFDKGTLDFDILVATPQLMPQLGRYARLLGPRGLMPNPKSGTVTTDVARAVADAKAGRVEYRVDSTGIVHLGVGKVSFTAARLTDNVQAVLTSIKANKPNSAKGAYMKAVYLTTTMGPSISIDVAGL